MENAIDYSKGRERLVIIQMESDIRSWLGTNMQSSSCNV